MQEIGSSFVAFLEQRKRRAGHFARGVGKVDDDVEMIAVANQHRRERAPGPVLRPGIPETAGLPDEFGWDAVV